MENFVLDFLTLDINTKNSIKQLIRNLFFLSEFRKKILRKIENFNLPSETTPESSKGGKHMTTAGLYMHTHSYSHRTALRIAGKASTKCIPLIMLYMFNSPSSSSIISLIVLVYPKCVRNIIADKLINQIVLGCKPVHFLMVHPNIITNKRPTKSLKIIFREYKTDLIWDITCEHFEKNCSLNDLQDEMWFSFDKLSKEI
ncbi:hypothetical protein AGLY_013609 [Aphis glycines]|uniref:Uncharacterized protein n=1 Tax=Aphis glycines TaxID=307491 RepID=A0A6G0T6T6_APHGL|nr:hypothetical protein AGLY_013609 [Aphis glycines]